MIEIGRINIKCGCENWWKTHLILLRRYHPFKVSFVPRWDELKACFRHSHLILTLLNRLFFLLFLLHLLRLLLILNNWHFNGVFRLIWLLVHHEHNLISGYGWFFCGLLGGFVGSCLGVPWELPWILLGAHREHIRNSLEIMSIHHVSSGACWELLTNSFGAYEELI